MTSKHLLILDLPAGNDTHIIQAALARGDSFSFLTSDLSSYEASAEVWEWVKQAHHLVEIENYNEAEIHLYMKALHQFEHFDALLCLVDHRLEVAARLAQVLGLKFLNPETAQLLNDNFKVNELLQSEGIAQATCAQGVSADEHLVEEPHAQSRVVGCDVFTRDGLHELLGVSEKKFSDNPSVALEGDCFTPMHEEWEFLERYVFSLLDAVGLDWGATHIELMLTPQGPRCLDIKARLADGQAPRLIGTALDACIHSRLIDLHLGVPHNMPSTAAPRVAVSRWVVAQRSGVFNRVDLPQWQDAGIRGVQMHKQPGDWVDNVDRMACVVTTADTRAQAQALAERFVADCVVKYQHIYLVVRNDQPLRSSPMPAQEIFEPRVKHA